MPASVSEQAQLALSRLLMTAYPCPPPVAAGGVGAEGEEQDKLEAGTAPVDMSVAGEILRAVALSWQVQQGDELSPGPFAVAGISAGGKANGKGKDKDRDADRAEAEACVSRSAKLLLALSLQVLHV